MPKVLKSFISLALVASALPLASPVLAQTDPNPVAAKRETEPVVLTGDRFARWAAAADVALEGPTTKGGECELDGHEKPGEDPCTHNRYEDPDFQSSDVTEDERNPQKGVPVDRLLGYRWVTDGDDGRFEQIPFQVDEMFVRYLSNNNSGFAFYSETDQHTSYAFNREGFRWLGDRAKDPDYAGNDLAPCLARPTSEVAKDPVKGLDTDDELVFMYDDAGARADATAPLPPGVQDSYEIAVTDPTRPGTVSFAYVMLAGPDGPAPAYDHTDGYVRYERDDPEDGNLFLYSQSSYGNYGATQKGPVAKEVVGPDGEKKWVCDTSVKLQRRPSDKATVTTPRYRFRYEGRWLMTDLEVSEGARNGETFADLGSAPTSDGWYGPDLIDQWKARAFQQRPGGQTPCCGYEEEVNNWGGSSILMGERWGPVRVIRETWGADSGTNVVRREIFYRDEIRFGTFLRVHVIPPLDGIYAQWDYNAGRVETYHNSWLASQNEPPVDIDGESDEVFGNSRLHVGPDGVRVNPHGDGNDEGDDEDDEVVLGNPAEDCDGYDEKECLDNDVDSPDPTHSGVNQGVIWEQVSGPNGSLVWRTALTKVTPGSAHSVAAVPYYRDDSCFDDGTGSNPGPHLNPRAPEEDKEEYTKTLDGEDRRCWTPEDGVPSDDSDRAFWQGSIGTHGVHILLIADSDNAHTPLPLTEIDSEARAVVIPGNPGNVGEAYGRAPEKPLVVATIDESRSKSPPAETSLVISGATSGQATDEVTLAATLSDERGPIPGKEIAFTLGGRDVGSATTAGDGVATLSVTLEGPARSTDLSAEFAGDDAYATSSVTAPFEIQHDDSKLELSLSPQGNVVEVRAILTDEDSGQGLGDELVTFFVDGVAVATARTDASGVALATVKAKKGATVRASFEQSDTYAASSAEQVVPR